MLEYMALFTNTLQQQLITFCFVFLLELHEHSALLHLREEGIQWEGAVQSTGEWGGACGLGLGTHLAQNIHIAEFSPQHCCSGGISLGTADIWGRSVLSLELSCMV
jgi:hypothetical protein